MSNIEDEKAGLFKAGKVALWIWVVLALIPVVAIIACCGLCGLGGIIGSVNPSPTPTF